MCQWGKSPPFCITVISVFRSSSRSNATHSIGELKNTPQRPKMAWRSQFIEISIKNWREKLKPDLTSHLWYTAMLLHAIFGLWGVFLASSGLHEVRGQKNMPMLNLTANWWTTTSFRGLRFSGVICKTSGICLTI